MIRKEKRTALIQIRVTPSFKRLSKKWKDFTNDEIIEHMMKKFKRWEDKENE